MGPKMGPVLAPKKWYFFEVIRVIFGARLGSRFWTGRGRGLEHLRGGGPSGGLREGGPKKEGGLAGQPSTSSCHADPSNMIDDCITSAHPSLKFEI